MSMSIKTTPIKLTTQVIQGKFEVNSRDAKLNLKQKHAKINIETDLPKVHIDQSEAFASGGRKGVEALSRENAQLGEVQAAKYTSKMASDGDRLAKIEAGGNPIADIAERDAFPEKEFNNALVLVTKPKISVTGGVKIEAERNFEGIHNGVEIEYVPGELNVNITPAKLKIAVKQYNSISIRYIPDKKIDVAL